MGEEIHTPKHLKATDMLDQEQQMICIPELFQLWI